MKLCPKFSELDGLCPIELRLISKIMSFIFIVPKTKGVQHGLKGKSISMALKRWLTDKGLINKQQILLALVNTALHILTKINPFFSNINIDNEWKDLIEQLDQCYGNF